MKSLKAISWLVDEDTYRQDSALSYSTLARYERGGFDSLKNLFDKVESPSLLYGSLVDTLVTGTPEEFDSRFFVCDFPDVPDSIITIVKALYEAYSDRFNDLNNIAISDIIAMADFYKYQPNWKPETRAKVIKEKGEEYYNLLFLAGNKTIVSTDNYNDAVNAYNALKDSESTKYYFAPDNPFDDIERCYQLKFKATIDNIDYRIMADLILIDHKNKIIIPADLKTSGKEEYNFHKSFKDWGYWWQAILYTKVIEENIKKDDYFKDFKIMPYIFIVVNRKSLTPMVWEFTQNHIDVDMVFGKDNQIKIRHPFNIAKELKYYLDSGDTVPIGINKNGVNDLCKWLNTL